MNPANGTKIWLVPGMKNSGTCHTAQTTASTRLPSQGPVAPPAGPGCIRASPVLLVRRRRRSSAADTAGRPKLKVGASPVSALPTTPAVSTPARWFRRVPAGARATPTSRNEDPAVRADSRERRPARAASEGSGRLPQPARRRRLQAMARSVRRGGPCGAGRCPSPARTSGSQISHDQANVTTKKRNGNRSRSAASPAVVSRTALTRRALLSTPRARGLAC